ncbi:MAG: hypothetical protein KDH96_07575, partial [Candidatus Riesia sp.]|nr:hypothetical protein [Candidatus Riesia sp.]
MSYTRPGVEVTMVQRTLSPNVATPDLEPILIGEGYYVTEITDNADSSFWATLSNNTLTRIYGVSGYSGAYIGWSGIDTTVETVNTITITIPAEVAISTIDSNSVYVDLVGSRYTYSGANAGQVRHLWVPEEASINTSTNVVTISGIGVNGYNISGLWSGSKVQVGFRARRSDLAQYFTVDSVDAIETQIGKICSENPLALSAYNTLVNSNAVVSVYGMSGIASGDYSSALEDISSKDVYILVPLTQSSTIETLVVSHVDTYSSAANKRERIALINRAAHSNITSTASKTTVAQDLASQAYERANRRISWIIPPICYVEERKHVSQLRPSYVQNMMVGQGDTAFSPSSVFAKTIGTITLSTGKKYYDNTEITQAIWSGLVNDGTYHYLTVRYPVPGVHVAATLAGQIVGLPAGSAFTNRTIAGNIVEVKYSSDWFSESQLDTIAGGGNLIMFQNNKDGLIKSRHALTTDMSSVERRELSITI